MRIASLVPSATEMLFALGLGDGVVAVTHECDHPPAALERPHVTRSVIPAGLSTAEIDRAVRERTERGEALYELDAARLATLAPDLVVTQAVCEVCAVSYDDVVAVAARLPTRPRVLSLDPSTLGDVLADVGRLAEAAGAAGAGAALARDAEARLTDVREAVAGARRPRVLALEWLAPPFVGGHWVPEMIELAGGEDVLGRPGDRSRTATWEELGASRPDVVVVMPCGYDAPGARDEARAHRAELAALGAGAVHAVDAAAYFSRPGPRLVDGVELLAHLLHPDRVRAFAGTPALAVR
ncbi:MAG TPA: ABC transporter substrate-binding protein [Candidatus Dormibacteraeota bacterium]|nr:ABC transporter substrate-binding protein [Candidatus Dormibacteraeota bacterium]